MRVGLDNDLSVSGTEAPDKAQQKSLTKQRFTESSVESSLQSGLVCGGLGSLITLMHRGKVSKSLDH